MRQKKITAIIMTGGQGARMEGEKLPKQFLSVLGKPLFLHTLCLYEEIKEVSSVCLVINEQYRALYEKILKKHPVSKLKYIVGGGASRQESIRNAVSVLKDFEYVVLHNGVNPAASRALIRKCIRQAKRDGVAIAYEPSYHTIFRRKDQEFCKAYRREKLGYGSDPFVLRRSIMLKALSKTKKDLTKEVPVLEMLEKISQPIALVKSDPTNIKVTYQHDLETIRSILHAKRIVKTLEV